MSLGEALSTGLLTTVLGMVIVFAVLAILMAVLILMKKVFYQEPAKKTAPAPAQPAPVPAPAPVKTQPAADDEELIAVLTAAVAASLNTSTYNLRIKSYRRVGNQAPAWNRAGLQETINSRY